MAALIHQRCLYHASREAVSLCLDCRHYFCRECVTEHSGKLICSSCLAKLVATVPASKNSDWRYWSLWAFGGLLLCWIVQYYLGWALTQIPSAIHQSKL